jgi:glutamate dehydrogenase
MTAILSMDVDLLWFGGIGTYIKDARENRRRCRRSGQ